MDVMCSATAFPHTSLLILGGIGVAVVGLLYMLYRLTYFD